MLIFFLLWPFLEIFLFVKAVQTYGFFHPFMAMLTAFFFGLLIIKTQGRTLLFKVQSELQQGKVPAQTLINSALLFIGGVFIMVPGFFSDVMGILLVLPGTRHLMSLYVRTYLARKISAGTFRVFSSFENTPPGFGKREFEDNSRDVSPRVIDVKPISSTEERE